MDPPSKDHPRDLPPRRRGALHLLLGNPLRVAGLGGVAAIVVWTTCVLLPEDDAFLLGEITLDALLAKLPEQLIVDEALFDRWKGAHNVRVVQIINGLERGMLSKALAGLRVGTIIRKPDDPS